MKQSKASPRRVRPVLPHPTDPTAALVQLTKGYWAVIDAADAEAVGQFNWIAAPRDRRIYAARQVGGRKSKRTVFLHQFVAERAGVARKRTVDHRNENGLDCRRMNLRPATQQENLANRGAQRNSKTGIKGVSFDSKRKTWCASVKAGSTRRQGRFPTKESAVEAVSTWRRELHGTFANNGVN